MPWNVKLNDLRGALAGLYPAEADARRVAASAGLAVERITFGGSASNMWQSALEQALRQECVGEVIAVARQEYPNNRALARAIDRYAPAAQVSAEPGVTPAGALGLCRVFISYATEADKEIAHRLADDLRRRGAAIWIAPESIRAGETWMEAIERGLGESDAMVVLLTPAAVRSRWVRREMEAAISLEIEGRMRILPLRVQDCQVPLLWRSYQWIPLADYDAGLARLVGELSPAAAHDTKEGGVPLTSTPAPSPSVEMTGPSVTQRPPQDAPVVRQPFEPELVLIPAGEFLMGSDPAKDKRALDDEQPQHRLYLPDYYLAKTPVTNAQYEAFVRATNHRTTAEVEGWSYAWTGSKWDRVQGSDWQHPEGPSSDVRQRSNHPVVHVSWHDALAYCRWLAEVTGKAYALPSEAEWEKGARGADGRIYPWGDAWDKARCNSWESSIGATTPVDRYPQGAGPYGLLDMAGNVWEWTRSVYMAYPYRPEEAEREDLAAGPERLRVLRGGSCYYEAGDARCAYRYGDLPHHYFASNGFRVVVASSV